MPVKPFLRRLGIGAGIVALALGLTATPSGAQQTIIDTIPARDFPFTGKFIPRHISGDRDYAGHGPRVTARVFVDIAAPNRVTLQICMTAVETTSDFTFAEGCSLRFQIYQSNVGHCVQSVAINPVDTLTYIDTDHADDVFGIQQLLSSVGTWTVTGDTSGNDAGEDTGVRVRTRDMRVTSVPC